MPTGNEPASASISAPLSSEVPTTSSMTGNAARLVSISTVRFDLPLAAPRSLS
jgi:eukaryotic-like serine/threonine-protein kinase